MYQLLWLLLLLGRSEAVIYSLNASEYYKMPPLYAMDDYDICMSEFDAIYCVVDVDLLPGSNRELMNMIQQYSENTKKHFNHTNIHRAVCVTETCKDFLKKSHTNETDLEEVLDACLNNSMHSKYGLGGKVANVLYCNRKDEKAEIDTSDIIVAVVYILLILLNVIGSIYDNLFCKEEEKSGNPFLLAFSLRRNWNRMVASNSNPKEPRLERLKLFHGMRTMTMICVLFSHTTIIMSIAYVANPLYMENAYVDPLKQLLFNGSLVTHTFFLISSFLLAYNFMMHIEKHPISWMYLPKGILLRWLRLTPAYALILATVATWVRHWFQGPFWKLIVTSESNACRQYWWAQIFYINNYVYDDALCMPQTWYLAADTQLFILGLTVCVAARTPRARTVTLSVLMALGLVAIAAHTYFQDLDAAVIQSPETYRNLYATDNTFRLLYIRAHTSLSPFVLGLAGGFIAYHWTNGKDLNQLKKYRWVQWAMFPLGVAVILSGNLFYKDGDRASLLLRVVYATFYKPIFHLAVIGIIMGCVFRLETVYRGIIEWRGFTWLGRVSYGAYLVHTVLQRGLAGAQMQLFYFSDYFVMTLLAATIFLSFLVGSLLFLLVEAPLAGVVRAAFTPPRRCETEDCGTKV